jgi:hypothetical protein
MKKLYMIALALLPVSGLFAQCNPGEVEVYIDVITDDYGYETYWELVPGGNGCGNGTIFMGGNAAVGCNGGGAQAQIPGGYGNNLTITEGPWCLVDGNTYDIEWVDDWGDDGLNFEVRIEGIPSYQFTGTGQGNTFPFLATIPDPYDCAIESINTFGYVGAGNIDVDATFINYGSATVNDIEVHYSIDNGPTFSQTLTGLTVAPYDSYNFIHNIVWNETVHGMYSLKVWTGDINGGNADTDLSNDDMTKQVEVGPSRINLVDQYLSGTPTLSVMGNSSDGVSVPRDLEFHPRLSIKQLWVINKSTENSGGTTVTFDNAGEGNQTSLLKQDGNAWHFMSLPTGIAFGENYNFATSPGVYDANHQGSGTPFTGPTLWSSDLAIYAEPSGGNGSHLDMLHVSPYSQGIAHEKDNVYWVVDGYSNDIVRYDFVDDHGPGNSYHGDAIIRRYNDVNIAKDPNDHIVSHSVLDKATGWLYIVDHGNDRILRLDVNTGTIGGTPSFGPFEGIVEYSYVTGYTWEEIVNTGLVEPSGIAHIDDRLLVTDHSNGDIIVYDVNNNFNEIGRIQTGAPGIMGIEIGPEGHIWYVNASTSEVVRLDMIGLGTGDLSLENQLTIHPNPSQGVITINSTVEMAGMEIVLTDVTGRIVHRENNLGSFTQTMDLSMLPNGVYTLTLASAKTMVSKRIILNK